MEIATLADQDTVIGFKLAGVKDGFVFTPETVKDSLAAVAGAKILILTEKVATYLREHELLDRVTATIAEIPDKSGSSGAALENLSRLFEEAIGVKLKN